MDRNLKYEGNFIKGKKWNGKEYDGSEKNIVYKLKEGNGFIKENNLYGQLIFEGNYLNGERNGKGIKYLNYELKFKGEYLNGKKNGKGRSYYPSGELKFEGEYFNGKKWNGKGYDNNNTLQYEMNNGKGYVKNIYFLTEN